MSNPTCQHAECHDVRTNTYLPTNWYTAASGNPISTGEVRTVRVGGDGPMWRRLCRIHARQEVGVSFG